MMNLHSGAKRNFCKRSWKCRLHYENGDRLLLPNSLNEKPIYIKTASPKKECSSLRGILDTFDTSPYDSRFTFFRIVIVKIFFTSIKRITSGESGSLTSRAIIDFESTRQIKMRKLVKFRKMNFSQKPNSRKRVIKTWICRNLNTRHVNPNLKLHRSNANPLVKIVWKIAQKTLKMAYKMSWRPANAGL